MVGFPDIDFPNPAAEAAFRMGYEGTDEEMRAFLVGPDGARCDDRDCLFWLVAGALGAKRLEPFELFAEVGIPIPDREFALKNAVKKNWVECVRFLLNHGTDVEQADDDGYTPLITAAEKGQTEVVRLLLKNGARVSARDAQNRTALHHAAEHAQTEVVECLLEAGANPNDRNGDSTETALHAAARGSGLDSSGEEYRQIIRLLIDRGADVDAIDRGGCTPLLSAAMNGRVVTIDELVEHGACLETTEENGQSLLHAAVIGNRYRSVESVLSRGLSTELRNRFGSTPLHQAYDSPEVAKLLISRGADVNGLDNSGGTPLHTAAYQGRISTISLLLARGADPSLRNTAGLTPADAALERGHRDCAKLIWECDYHRRQKSQPPLADAT